MTTPTTADDWAALQEIWLFFYAPVFWFAASWVVAWAAEQRGRSHLCWFALSLLFTPPFAVLALIAAGAKKSA